MHFSPEFFAVQQQTTLYRGGLVIPDVQIQPQDPNLSYVGQLLEAVRDDRIQWQFSIEEIPHSIERAEKEFQIVGLSNSDGPKAVAAALKQVIFATQQSGAVVRGGYENRTELGGWELVRFAGLAAREFCTWQDGTRRSTSLFRGQAAKGTVE